MFSMGEILRFRWMTLRECAAWSIRQSVFDLEAHVGDHAVGLAGFLSRCD
jgi:hypothetical protein